MEGYVIDHVDTEYSFRAICNGVPVYINTSLVLRHEVGKRTDHKVWFFKIIQWNTGPLRQYYSARNCIHLLRRYGAQFPLLILVNIITMQQILSIAIYEKDKRKKLIAMMSGILDGLRGRFGSFETCWPRTFTFCTGPSHGTAKLDAGSSENYADRQYATASASPTTGAATEPRTK
jgi:rhamnosyltransferase